MEIVHHADMLKSKEQILSSPFKVINTKRVISLLDALIWHSLAKIKKLSVNLVEAEDELDELKDLIS